MLSQNDTHQRVCRKTQVVIPIVAVMRIFGKPIHRLVEWNRRTLRRFSVRPAGRGLSPTPLARARGVQVLFGTHNTGAYQLLLLRARQGRSQVIPQDRTRCMSALVQPRCRVWSKFSYRLPHGECELLAIRVVLASSFALTQPM